MKGKNVSLRGLRKLADMSDGVLPGIPLVEICGDKRVLIEHHQGVVAYGNWEICVKVCYGILSVIGERLTLTCMTKEQLVICGRIDGVRLLRKGNADGGKNHM